MNPWIETFFVLLLAAAGALCGLWFSRKASPLWLLGYAIPLLLIITIGIGRRFPSTQFTPPISWILAGRTEFALTGFLTCMLLCTPLSRLPVPGQRRGVIAIMILMTLLHGAWPFAAPAFNRSTLLSTLTRWDNDRVCRQTTEYTCGPAAAVTALDRLGIQAEEGTIAVTAHTSNAIGTPEDLLSSALHSLFHHQGIQSHVAFFPQLQDIPPDPATITIAVIRFSALVDHYVTILEITPHTVVVGDPFRGKQTLSHADFLKVWRNTAVVLRRAPPPSPLKPGPPTASHPFPHRIRAVVQFLPLLNAIPAAPALSFQSS